MLLIKIKDVNSFIYIFFGVDGWGDAVDLSSLGGAHSLRL